MVVILEYLFETYSNEIEIPSGADYLTCKIQNGIPTAWFKVYPDQKKEKRIFQLIATRQPFVSIDNIYLDTIIFENGLVYHVHEKRRKKNELY